MANNENLNLSALWVWGRSSPRRLFFLLRVAWRLWRANSRRKQKQLTIDGPIPYVVAISPTMRCTYNCLGCYSRGRNDYDELTTEEIDNLFTEAEKLGVLVIVVTGGEPLLRDDILKLIARHQRLLFIPITNGSLVTPNIAKRIGRIGNIIPLVSLEGYTIHTDERRQTGAHETVIRTFKRLREAGACFGFAAMNTSANTEYLSTDRFIDQMISYGCAVGFFSEYVPCGPNPRPEWKIDEDTRAAFRRQVLDFRRRKPILLSQFPHDEYGQDNQCVGAGRASLHINSQGGVEPCPYIPFSRENIRQGGLLAACRSSFLRAIRQQPDILKRQRFACALFEHRTQLEATAEKYGAHSSETKVETEPR